MAKFKIRNKKRQKFPIEIVENGEIKLVHINAKGKVFSEEKTSRIKELEKRRIISVTEVVDEDEDG